MKGASEPSRSLLFHQASRVNDFLIEKSVERAVDGLSSLMV
jgi:hypothetical protein